MKSELLIKDIGPIAWGLFLHGVKNSTISLQGNKVGRLLGAEDHYYLPPEGEDYIEHLLFSVRVITPWLASLILAEEGFGILEVHGVLLMPIYEMGPLTNTRQIQHLASKKERLKLYDTGDLHSNGWKVFRKEGVSNKRDRNGSLSGEYFAYDGDTMYLCGKPYFSEEGFFDGEPLYPI